MEGGEGCSDPLLLSGFWVGNLGWGRKQNNTTQKQNNRHLCSAWENVAKNKNTGNRRACSNAQKVTSLCVWKSKHLTVKQTDVQAWVFPLRSFDFVQKKRGDFVANGRSVGRGKREQGLFIFQVPGEWVKGQEASEGRRENGCNARVYKKSKQTDTERREGGICHKKLQYPSTILVIFAAIFTFPVMIFQPRFLNFRYPSPSPSLCWHSGNVQKAFFFPFPWRVDFLFSSIITHWRRVYLPVNQAGGESFPPLGKRRRLVSKGEPSSWKDTFLQNNKNYVAFH